MIRFVAAALALQASLYVGMCEAADDRERLTKLLAARSSIESYSAECTIRTFAPSERESRLYTVYADGVFRTDHQRIEFSDYRSAENTSNRVVLLPDNVVRFRRSVGQTGLDYNTDSLHLVVDLRLAAMVLAPFGNINPNQYTLENSLVSRVLQSITDVENVVIDSVQCSAVYNIDSSNKKRSVLFEKANDHFRGVRLESDGYISMAWLTRTVPVDAVEIPQQLKYSQINADGETDYEQVVTIKNIRINEEIPLETFDFAALGVQPGEVVDVRNDPQRGEYVKMYWNGTELVDTEVELLPSSRSLTWRVVAGVVLILIAVAFALRLLTRRRLA